MAITVTQKTVFTFSKEIDGVNYNFQIYNDTETAAREQLTKALKQIVVELEAHKAGTRPS